jgi:succinylarginine dihydrolase
MEEQAYEVNFDGLAGPTHNYGGLSYGNLASMRSGLSVSSPRAALLQGLSKMRLPASLGLKQAVLPPQERPDFNVLRRLGYSGSAADILARVARDYPGLLSACCSSSAMWAANAATVSPSADTRDNKVHFTPANLVTYFHRSIEASSTGRILREIFKNEEAFVHHDPLPATLSFSDEGAANHTRLCRSYGGEGIEVFAYGRSILDRVAQGPGLYPARQSLEASAAIARLHKLDPERTVFVRQNPRAVDAGVFHNDVISVGNGDVFFHHAEAFQDTEEVVAKLRETFARFFNGDLAVLTVRQEDLSLEEAVSTYLFNSQLVTLPDGTTHLLAPVECEESENVRAVLQGMSGGENPIAQIHYVDVRQSMENGGGPACLRLRVVLTERELSLTHQGVLLTDSLYRRLTEWGNKHYRDRLHLDDLADPALTEESRTALDELTQILGLGSLYDFQRKGV